MLVMGHVPTKAEILLRTGCDFTWTLTVSDDELMPEDTTVKLYVYERDAETLIGFWPAIMVPGEIIEGSTEVETVAGNPTVVTVPDQLVPDQAQLQIYADDHALIPDGAKFTVILEKTGYPKTPWLEGRVSKVNR